MRETSANLWDSPTAAPVAAARPNIVALSRAAETAVIAPRDGGAWWADWRRAVAARIATLNGQDAMAANWREGLDGEALKVADPAAGTDTILGFVDGVATHPKDVTAADVEALKAAGVSEADIVRLCELVAFISYQCRVAAGMALLEGAAQ
ncbi:hypothetical protein DRW48_14555 [Paracoccus suum]|uniref:CMD domain protein n=1 Tax=Paracoccus suum TaxID=2259340 RepID=A0A344PMY3_9RHOB|nr:hypothetical protein [Paracoccus suum]AXC50738.1 hypothetical protein DRW48_14555 [Paracoccus suum]